MLGSITKEHGIKFGFVQNEYNADNGAMIAILTQKMLDYKVKSDINTCGIDQRFRINNVMVYK